MLIDEIIFNKKKILDHSEMWPLLTRNTTTLTFRTIQKHNCANDDDLITSGIDAK